MRFGISALVLCCAVCGACSEDDDRHNAWRYPILPKSGASVSGAVEVVDEAGEVTLRIEVEGASPGEHGLHIHETGDCSADDASSAGGHWNPEGHPHGEPDGESHLGDLGNLTVDASGTGKLTISKEAWTLGDGSDTDLFGKALVLHAMPDDLTTQPSGASGDRIGCAVLEAP